MKIEELKLESKILSMLIIACNDQGAMLKGHYKQEDKQMLNRWMTQGNSLLKRIQIGSGNENEDVMIEFTAQMHDFMDLMRTQILKENL